MSSFVRTFCAFALFIFVAPSRGAAQHADHAAHQRAAADTVLPSAPNRATLPGQDAFGAIAEIVRILQRDPSTDWTKVNLEALRQHLIDMHDVTLTSVVRSEPIDGGVLLTVTGSGRTKDAIRRMVTAHGHMLMAEGLDGSVENVTDGVRWRVTTRDPGRVAEVRGLGFIGILALGEHHTSHHLALARGENPH